MVIKPDADLASVYEDATEVEQVFIKKLALFFTGESRRGVSCVSTSSFAYATVMLSFLS